MNITLSTLVDEDAPQLAILANNPNVSAWVRDIFPSPYSEQDAHQFLAYLVTQQPLTTFGIRYESKLAGVAGLVLQSDIFRKSAEIGYWLGEPFWGKGIATAVAKMLCELGFEQFGLVRLYAGVFESNTASMKVLEKAGFRLESIARKALIKRSQIYDNYIYAMTTEDWEKIKNS